MFFLYSISLKNWNRNESFAVLILLMAEYIFSAVSAYYFKEFMYFSKSLSIFSQFYPYFGFRLIMKFSLTTSSSEWSSVFAFSQ